MMKPLFLILLTLACQSRDRVVAPVEDYLYENTDGRTVLMISEGYYYLGTKDHPETPDFVKEYGEKMEAVAIKGGTCLSLGVFKLAVFNEEEATCANVHIKKLAAAGTRSVQSYVATCFEFQGPGCSPAKGEGKPALSYGYKVDSEKGVTEIYLFDDASGDATSTYVLKTGMGLLI